MTNNDFYLLFENMNKQEKECMLGKGEEYTMSSDDKLKNFKDVGKMLDIEPLKVAGIYWLKHVFSIINYIKTGKTSSVESIESRIMDARNYLALIQGLINESYFEDK